MSTASCIAAALLVSAPASWADAPTAGTPAPPPTPLPWRAISLELPALVANVINLAVPQGSALPAPGFELNAEVFSPDRHWSGVLALGTRWSQSGQSASGWTASTGIEGRFWLRLGEIPSMKGLGGPLVGLRIDESMTHVAIQGLGPFDESTTVWATELSLRAGYRFAFAHRIELTPEVGTGVNEIGRWTAAGARPTLLLGLTIGYLF